MTTDTISAPAPVEERLESAAWKRWLSIQGYGLVMRSLFPPNASPLAMRKRFERFGRTPRTKLQAKHPNLVFEDHAFGHQAMESVRAVDTPTCVVLHIHGGGHFMGSPSSYRSRTKRLSYRCNAEVFVPDYRLSPEHPAPAALEDALDAWCEVQRLRPGAVKFVSGDSSGGGVALAMMVALRDQGLPLPAGAILFSPWTDLTVSGASVDANASNDVWGARALLEGWAPHCLGDLDPRDPRISPVFADLGGLPPLLLLAGEYEALLDDSRRVHERALAKGVASSLHVGPRMQHDWPLTLPWLAESRDAWSAIAAFVEKNTKGART